MPTRGALLAAAVRHISAEDKKQALGAAGDAMRQLTFEFKHPILVQRAMYGLATAQIEGWAPGGSGGDLDAA